MLLEPHERDRFCQYLRQNIENGKVMVEQFEKLTYGEMLVKRERKRILGWLIVLEDLESAEDMTIGGE